MLIRCPECDLQVSDKAITCPHCGYPLYSGQKRTNKPKNTKRRRLPNGFGQISEIKNRNLRKPFRAMVSIGKAENGRPIVKPLKPESFFETYNDAYAALVEYNRNPYDLDPAITMEELYKKWSKEHFANMKSLTAMNAIERAWGHCQSVYNMRVKDFRIRHLKGCLEEDMPATVQYQMKSMFNMMLDYAVEYGLTDQNYARQYKLPKDVSKELATTKNGHIPFSSDELKILWENVNIKSSVDILLIQCYSGWRPQELGLIKVENVDLENKLFIGGMKTEAGINRTVPIHSKIFPLVKAQKEEALRIGSEYLLNDQDPRHRRKSNHLTYDRYQKNFHRIIEELHLNPEHRPHDGRKTFVTLCKKYKVDEYAIKYMVGHHIADLTEKVYTERDSKWFHDEIEKIKE